jgi:hypothetical protein
MSSCRGCARPATPGALTCSACGQRHPSGALPSMAGGVLLLFGVAVLAALAQVLAPKDHDAAADLPRGQVVDRWGVGLHGVGQALVVPRSLLTDEGMTVVRRELRDGMGDRRFVRAYLFTDEAAARDWREGLAGELGERQASFDRAFVGRYERNDRLGTESLSFAREGLGMTQRPRTLEW